MLMNALTDGYSLSNGVQIPCIGFGTWGMPEGEGAVSTILSAMEAGYRHIDTAQGYFNEDKVGRAIQKSGLRRRELFITSKLMTSEHGYEKTLAAFERSLEQLGTDYLDLFLIHWPNPIAFRGCWEEANAGTWRAFEELYRAGRVRAIGISNFRRHHMEALLKTAEVVPMVHQIRLCPGDTQDEVAAFSRFHGMLLEAYSPLGGGGIFEVPQMQALAEKHGRSVAQICVRWSLECGWLPLPRSVSPARIRANAEVFDFRLEPEDIRLLADLKGCVGYSTDPDTITW